MSGSSEDEEKPDKWLGWGFLRAERDRRGWSERKAGQFFGVSQPSYHRWEDPNGNRPDKKHFPRIAEFLGISTGEVHNLRYAAGAPADSNAAMGSELTTLRGYYEQLMDSNAEMADELVRLKGEVALMNAQLKGLFRLVGPAEFVTDVPPENAGHE